MISIKIARIIEETKIKNILTIVNLLLTFSLQKNTLNF